MYKILSFVAALGLLLLADAKSGKKHNPFKGIEFNKHFKSRLDESSLQFLFIVARAGEIFPDNYMMKADTKYEYKNYEFPAGELNENGKTSMYELGDKIKKMYPNFLNKQATRKNLLQVTAVGSEYTLSTREAAVLVLKGLTRKDKKESVKIRKWSAKQLSTTRNDEFTDAASNFYSDCPNYQKEYNQALTKEFFKPNVKTKLKRLIEIGKSKGDEQNVIDMLKKDIDDNTKRLIKSLNENADANITVENLTPLHDLYELYCSSDLSNLPPPEWLDADLWDSFHLLMRRYVNAIYSTEKLRLLSGGPIVKYFLNKVEDKLKGKLEPCDTKILLHIGYDSTVTALFAALAGKKGFKRLGDQYLLKTMRTYEGGMFIIEAHETDSPYDYWLRMLYSEDLHAPVYEVASVECKYPCSFRQLKKKFSKIAVDKEKWLQECNKDHKNGKTYRKTILKRVKRL